MTNKNSNIEEILLSGSSLDELIRMKIEAEYKAEISKTKSKTPEKRIVTEIKEVPKELIFSKNAIYRVFNRQTKQETYINGIQAEALIGLQNNVRTNFLNRETNAFSTDEFYIKFEKLCVNS